MTSKTLAAAEARRRFGLVLEGLRRARRWTLPETSARARSLCATLTDRRIGRLERGDSKIRQDELRTLIRIFPSLITATRPAGPIAPATVVYPTKPETETEPEPAR